jgi:catechol 2,3-dioxygenase-like lactoylglutathione lyase family enzyme
MLNQVSLVVRDMASTVAFYRRLGLVVADDNAWSAHHVVVEMANGLHLEFDSVTLTEGYDPGWPATASGGGAAILVFAFSSRQAVDDTFTDVTSAGYKGHQAPFDAFWGARYAVVEDPDGNKIGLMSPSDPDHAGPPPLAI